MGEHAGSPASEAFARFRSVLGRTRRGLCLADGDLETPLLQRASQSGLDETWEPPNAIASWRVGFPLELIRYAGANRLKVEIDYRAEQGGADHGLLSHIRFVEHQKAISCSS